MKCADCDGKGWYAVQNCSSLPWEAEQQQCEACKGTGEMGDTPRTDAIPRNAPFHHYRVEDVLDLCRQLEREFGKVRGDCEAWNRAYHEEKKRADQLERELAASESRHAADSEIWTQQRDQLRLALLDLLNHGTPVTNPMTGDPEPHQLNPESAIELLKSLEART